MFNFGIVAATIGRTCPGYNLIQVIEMTTGEIGLVYPSGIIQWLPIRILK